MLEKSGLGPPDFWKIIKIGAAVFASITIVAVAIYFFWGLITAGMKLHFDEPEMVFVEGGAITLGCIPEEGSDCFDDERPAHQVTLSSFSIGKYPVTQAEWKAVMRTTVKQQRDKTIRTWPVYGVGDNYPMYYISWEDAQKFIERLNAATGKKYRLPTEAEWEYAARGGNQSMGYKYSGSNNLRDVAWYSANSFKYTHAVGSKNPNELDIFDMCGNVWEWCNNWYGDDSMEEQIDPQGPSSGYSRVLRGGSWGTAMQRCRVSSRYGASPSHRRGNFGFRVALSP